MSFSSDLEQTNQTLWEHLSELRTSVVRAGWGILIATILCYGFSEQVFDFIRSPIQQYLPTGGLVYTHPLDKFMAHIKLSFVLGAILSCPWWIYQIWRFVAPGLYRKERNYAFGFIFSGTSLFVAGASFAYWIVLPMAFKFLFHFGGDIDKPMITIADYLAFFSQMILMFGVSFELPLILVTLGLIGIIDRSFLTRNRRYAVMAMAVLAAIITPPDLLSMLMMLVPLLALYESAIIVLWIFEKKKAKQNERE